MSCLLKANAYHILGLDTLASEKEILKRSRDIINRLKIDDIPEYDLDLNDARGFRTEDSVKEALRLLQAPKKHIREYFFWYRIGDAIDERVAGLLKEKKYSEAIEVWQKASEAETAKAYLYRKNLAILFSSLLCLENNKDYLKKSLALWKSIFDSDKFWSAFSKLYRLHNEQTASDEMIREFRTKAVEYLSDVYAELHTLHTDTDYIQDFRQTFSAKGAVVEKKVLNPAYQTIYGAVEKLEGMKVSEDGKFDEGEARQIKESIRLIQTELNKLIDLGLFEDSQTKVMRDRAAHAIRKVVLDLHNNLSETSKARALLEVALEIAGTDSAVVKIKQEVAVLEKEILAADVAKPISELIATEQYEKAWELLKNEWQKHKDDAELLPLFESQAKLCITNIGIQKIASAHKFFSSKQEDEAKSLFIQAGQLIYQNLSLYDLNKESIDKILEEIKSNVRNASLQNLSQFDDYRASFVKIAKDKFEGKLEGAALIVIVDAAIFSGLADFIKRKREKAGVVTVLRVLGWLTIWFYGIGLIFFIAAWIYQAQD